MPDEYGMRALFEDGDGIEVVSIETRDEFNDVSEDASLLGSYWHAVADYLSGNDSAGLNVADFAGVEIGGRFLMTDLEEIEELAAEGELEFDDIYEES